MNQILFVKFQLQIYRIDCKLSVKLVSKKYRQIKVATVVWKYFIYFNESINGSFCIVNVQLYFAKGSQPVKFND